MEGTKTIQSRQPRPFTYPEGTFLFDVRYYRQTSENPECFEVVIWNPITRQMEVHYEEPIIDIWFLKPELRIHDYQVTQEYMDNCYPFFCKPSQVPRVIAQEIGGEWAERYKRNKDQMRQGDLARDMCECPWVFSADLDPTVYFRLRWFTQYGTTTDLERVTASYFDIEVDSIDRPVDLGDIEASPNPINAATLIMEEQQICAVFILGPRPKHKIDQKFWPLLERQKKEFDWLVKHQEEFKRMIRDDDADNAKYLADYEIRLHIFDFDDEIKLIKTICDYINKYKPNFCDSWNAKFDHPRLWHRIDYLGYDPKEFFIPKEFKTYRIYYQEDKSDNFSFKNSRDWFHVSSYTLWCCQMRRFAAIRKSQQERRSYSLNSVGSEMCGINKLTDSKSGAFRLFPYTDFLKFILYNVRDVVVQLAIGKTTNDHRTLTHRSWAYLTPFSKCFQETHIVRNSREYYYRTFAKTCQANRLLIDPDIDPAFKGAFVADPVHNAPTGLVLYGRNHNNIIYGALDADAESYYPSTKMGMNMDPMSLLYKLLINNENFQDGTCVNRSLCQEYFWYDSKNKPHKEDLSGPIVNAYKNRNVGSLMYNWFNMPSMTELFQYLDMCDTK